MPDTAYTFGEVIVRAVSMFAVIVGLSVIAGFGMAFLWRGLR